ncbi:IcmF-related protein [Rubellimicrobium mesophilum DSM 19309]|uniref:IcmF-related protein n=1 Tax=Rubellimicrobium mesophilum DSM 19309 TaxID=442562 RepID=A0A017HSI3_9RHOB|nr:type VI secretion system membrane subunit TssM [Rubellimicrobium mesophilum]EYD77452.1 IcmF-related protein [Rubellimicrobium mesophilum DSM 19309]
MRLLKSVFRFLFSRRLWTFIGVVLLCLLIWQFGAIVKIGDLVPLETETARLIAIGVVVILWLFSILIGQLRAARANQVFVTELARPAPTPPKPGEGAVGEINTKFQAILNEMKRSKLGSRRFLREMPWYIIIGPPGTGKTTALRQSGLHFPVDLSDDLKGVGGTRNCDWFFTDDAVLVDTAGRYTEQGSDPEADAAEWAGFLNLLKKHRGRRALNGVIVAISVRELLGPKEDLRAHGREIRKRLAELRDQLAMHLPVYLLVTKLDLVPGFEAFFEEMTTEEREQVWGTTLPVEGGVDSVTVERELQALAARAEARLAGRLASDVPLAQRAEIFRFPAQLLRLDAPLKLLTDAVFGETRYDEAPWLRGIYLTSATQEGSPIDRLVTELAEGFGLPVQAAAPARRGDKRSFFLRRVLTDVIFRESGLGILDLRAEERRKWMWRGTLAGAVLVTACLAAAFAFSFSRYSAFIDEQKRLLTGLQASLADVAVRQAPTDPLDLDVALEAVGKVQAASVAVPVHPLTSLGPTAQPELQQAERIAYERALSNILEPRMAALLEATIWARIRDPEFLLNALKTYFMMTGLGPYDRDFAAAWWQDVLPEAAPINPFPTDSALELQLDALDLLASEETKIEPDQKLVAVALESLCQVPLARRAYNALMSDPAVARLPKWTPAQVTGPNGAKVFTRLSGASLNAGLAGAYTYEGFHGTILPLLPEVAAQAAIDRLVFAGGCEESAEADADVLQAEMLRLYEQDFIAQWDGFLRDIRLAPLTDLTVATENLKDLASENSALKRLLRAVVDETDLTRVEAEAAEGEEGSAVPSGVLGPAIKRLGTIGRLARTGSRLVPVPARATMRRRPSRVRRWPRISVP